MKGSTVINNEVDLRYNFKTEQIFQHIFKR